MAGPTETRARRLLALLHLLERDARLSLESIAETLGASVVEIAEDIDSLSCCGVAPYDPGALMPIYVEDGIVEVFGELPALERSIRLSPGEAHALVAALQLAGLSATDPLLTRLMEAAGSPEVSATELEKSVRAAVEPGTSTIIGPVARAIKERQVLRIEYQSAGSDEPISRDIEPLQMLVERGVWYVEAYCRRAGALRTFRLDRIRTASAIGESFESRDLSPLGMALSTDDLPAALVRFAVGEHYSSREWPGSELADRGADGSITVSVPYAGTAWIARQVVARLGAVEVLEPAEVRTAVAALALDCLS